MNPFIQDIAALLLSCTDIIVWHVYQEVNSVADLVASYVAEYSGDILWTDLGEAPCQYHDIFFFLIFLDVFIIDFYCLNALSYQRK